MRIRSFAHKGLERLYSENSTRGVPPDTVDKLRKMFAYLDNLEEPEDLLSLVLWRAHLLTGDRKGTWSLNVTRNWRLTFWIDHTEPEICGVNLEDYH